MENKPQVFPASDKLSDAMKEVNEMGTKIAAQASNEIGVIENNKPNGELDAQAQMTKGVGGFIIVKDAAEAALALPRTYGTDDIVLIVCNSAFDD